MKQTCLHILHVQSEKIFSSTLPLFVELVKHMHDVLCLAWGKEATFKVNHVVFFVGNKFYMLEFTNPTKEEGVSRTCLTKRLGLKFYIMWRNDVLMLLQVWYEVWKTFFNSRIVECH